MNNLAEKKFRHELKYLISTAEMQLLRNRVCCLLKPDVHSGPGGIYSIRSLYFDDYQNRCFYENENGVDPREKFRIRIYNHSSEKITLECKRKECGKTLKTSCPLTVAQTLVLIEGKILPDLENQPPLLRRLTVEMLTRKMKPVVIVEYDRVPYVCKNGNVRITFDTNISTSKAIGSFLDPVIQKCPVLMRGQQLLEVKYDEYMPDPIYRSMQLGDLQQTAFSKYYICRKFSL